MSLLIQPFMLQPCFKCMTYVNPFLEQKSESKLNEANELLVNNATNKFNNVFHPDFSICDSRL